MIDCWLIDRRRFKIDNEAKTKWRAHMAEKCNGILNDKQIILAWINKALVRL